MTRIKPDLFFGTRRKIDSQNNYLCRSCFLYSAVLLTLVLLIIPVSAGTIALPGHGGFPGQGFLLGDNTGHASHSVVRDGVGTLLPAEDPYLFRYDDRNNTWLADNTGQHTRIREITTGEVTFSARDGSFGLKLAGVGRDDPKSTPGPGIVGAAGRKLEIRRAAFNEWYLNADNGIEQGMTLKTRPEGTGPLQVSYSLSGTLSPSLEGSTLRLFGPAGSVFTYAGLKAVDAKGHDLPARLLLSGNTLTWVIDDDHALYPITIDPTVTQEKILTASDGKTEDHFGTSIAVSGDTVIVGAPDADLGGLDKGQVYVFSRNYGGTGSWGQIKLLNASDGVSGDCFGKSVAIDGSTAVIGAICAGSDHTGQAYVFYQDYLGSNNWSEVKILTASDKAADAYFGTSVAIQGTTVVIGAPHADAGTGSTNQGQAYVFNRDQGGLDTWGQTAILNATDRAFGDKFGKSVAVSGTTAIIGADNATVSGVLGQGKAYVFNRDQGGTGNWGQVTILTASDGGVDAMFGNSVALDGVTAVVGAFEGLVSGSHMGEAYVFSRDKGGSNSWGVVKILTASDKMEGDKFGYAVAISGTRVVVGAPIADSETSASGKAYLFSRNLDGADNWGEEQILKASDRGESGYFGFSVAANGSSVAAGAENATVSGVLGQGKAYLFGTPAPAPTPTLAPGGGSDDRPAPVKHELKAPLQRPVSTVFLNVGQIGRTPIVRVEITGIEVKDTIVTAREAEGPGNGIPPPPGVVYEYVDITPARFTEITDAKIIFVVPLSWIAEHHLTPPEIVLYHNDGTTWEALPTTLNAIRDGEAYYTAEGSGFSRFAITGQFNATPGVQNVTPQRTVRSVGDLAGATPPGTPAPAVSPSMLAPVVTGTTAIPTAQPSPTLPVAALLIIIAAGVILALGVVMIRRWWIRRQNPALFGRDD